MLMRDCLGHVLMAKRGSSSGDDGGGGTATATVDIQRGSGEYTATDPGYSDELTPAEPEVKSAKSKDKAEKPDVSDKAEAAEEDSGTETADEATETAEKPSGEEEADEEDDDSFSDELLDRAVALGYTLQDIKSFRSERSLDRELTRVERLAQRIQERGASQTGKKNGEATAEELEEPDFEKMLADGYDETQLKLIKAHHERLKATNEKLQQIEQQTAGLQAQREREAIIAAEQRFEALIEGVGEEYKGLLGEGSGHELKRSSQEFKNRAEVFTEMQVRAEILRARGMQIPSEKELFKRAVASVFNGHAQSIARQKLKEDIKSAGSQALARPQSAGKKGLTGRQRAEERLEEYFRTHG